MPPEASQPDAPLLRRLLPRPAALTVTDDADAAHRHDVPRIWLPWIIRERDPDSRAVRREQMKLGWDQTTGLVMGLVMAPVAAALAFVGMELGVPIYLLYIGAFAIGSGFAWVMWWAAHRRIERHWQTLGRQWTDAGLTRGRCPLCLYSLAGAEADERGLTRCAECGAAWQQDRIAEHAERELPAWRRFLNHMLGADTRRSLRDDTGRAFAAERLRNIVARCRQREPEIAGIVAQVRESSGPARRGTALVIALLISGYVLLLLRRTMRLGASADTLLMLLLMLVGAAIVVGAILCTDFGLTARERRRQMLAAGLCPVCAGRDLAPHDLHPGHHHCARCSAIWRLP